MSQINAQIFKQQWDLIEEKIDQIAGLGGCYSTKFQFDRYEITPDGIKYVTTDTYDGETDSFEVEWVELAKPMDYFRQKADEYSNRIQQEHEARLRSKERETRNSDIAKLKELAAKYPDQI